MQRRRVLRSEKARQHLDLTGQGGRYVSDEEVEMDDQPAIVKEFAIYLKKKSQPQGSFGWLPYLRARKNRAVQAWRAGDPESAANFRAVFDLVVACIVKEYELKLERSVKAVLQAVAHEPRLSDFRRPSPLLSNGYIELPFLKFWLYVLRKGKEDRPGDALILHATGGKSTDRAEWTMPLRPSAEKEIVAFLLRTGAVIRKKGFDNVEPAIRRRYGDLRRSSKKRPRGAESLSASPSAEPSSPSQNPATPEAESQFTPENASRTAGSSKTTVAARKKRRP